MKDNEKEQNDNTPIIKLIAEQPQDGCGDELAVWDLASSDVKEDPFSTHEEAFRNFSFIAPAYDLLAEMADHMTKPRLAVTF